MWLSIPTLLGGYLIYLFIEGWSDAKRPTVSEYPPPPPTKGLELSAPYEVWARQAEADRQERWRQDPDGERQRVKDMLDRLRSISSD